MQAAVQLDHILATGLVMQRVDVLRDQPADMLAVLQGGQRQVRLVWLRNAHPWPAQHRPRPITAARLWGGQELLVHHRRLAPAYAFAVPVVRDTRRRADSCPGQHQKTPFGHGPVQDIEVVFLMFEHVEHGVSYSPRMYCSSCLIRLACSAMASLTRSPMESKPSSFPSTTTGKWRR